MEQPSTCFLNLKFHSERFVTALLFRDKDSKLKKKLVSQLDFIYRGGEIPCFLQHCQLLCTHHPTATTAETKQNLGLECKDLRLTCNLQIRLVPTSVSCFVFFSYFIRYRYYIRLQTHREYLVAESVDLEIHNNTRFPLKTIVFVVQPVSTGMTSIQLAKNKTSHQNVRMVSQNNADTFFPTRQREASRINGSTLG